MLPISLEPKNYYKVYAISEDTFESSNAELRYCSAVDPQNGLRDAIERVVHSYGTSIIIRPTLVQPMVESVTLSGVVFTQVLEFVRLVRCEF